MQKKIIIKRNWVDNQASIIGTDSVRINVGENTNLIGSVIANSTNGIIGEGAIDGANLTLNSKYLTYSNLQDSDKAKSFGLSLSAGAKNNGNQGSASLALNYSMHDYEQITKATIGNGNIKTGTSLNLDANNNLLSVDGGNEVNPSDLNRDITKSQEIIKWREVAPIKANYTYSWGTAADQNKKPVVGTLKEKLSAIVSNKLEDLNFGNAIKTIVGGVASDLSNLGVDKKVTNKINFAGETVGETARLGTNMVFDFANSKLGILPLAEQNGGVLFQIPALVFGDQKLVSGILSKDAKAKLEESTSQDKKDYTVVKDESGKYGEGYHGTYLVFNDGKAFEIEHYKARDLDTYLDNPILLTGKKDFIFNGLYNIEEEGILNGLKQLKTLQTNEFNLVYDPTHGLLPDIGEAVISAASSLATRASSKTIPTIGNLNEAKDLGQAIAQIQEKDVKMVGFSEGGERVYSGVLLGATKKQFKNLGLQVQLYGAPVNERNMQDAADHAGVNNPYQIRNVINQGDFVGKILGWNIDSAADFAIGVVGLPLLFTPLSTHTYLCQGSFCDVKATTNSISQ